jgi:hypothetical protein
MLNEGGPFQVHLISALLHTSPKRTKESVLARANHCSISSISSIACIFCSSLYVGERRLKGALPVYLSSVMRSLFILVFNA